MIKVRYHLQKGPNFMHWQFKDTKTKNVWYLEPNKYFIKLKNCVLHNNTKIAEKIYTGENKDVCAWIKCKEYEILPNDYVIPSWSTHIKYNPKVLPYWHTIQNQPPTSKNIDGTAFDELLLCEKGVFYDQCRNVASPI